MEPKSEPVEFLSAVLVTSPEPARLATFYREVLGLPLAPEEHGGSPGHWACELGDVHFAIHQGETAPGPGPVRFALWVMDLQRMVERLRGLGVELLHPVQRLGEESLVAALLDPDGNEVELTQMGATWFQHLREHRAAGGDVLARAPWPET